MSEMAARILLVEDESFIRSMMAEYLVEADFHVDEATNTDDALIALEAVAYDILVTDVTLPGQFNGIELAARFQEKAPNQPVLIVTARPELLGQARARGVAASVLAKPFDPDQLVALVTQLSKSADPSTL